MRLRNNDYLEFCLDTSFYFYRVITLRGELKIINEFDKLVLRLSAYEMKCLFPFLFKVSNPVRQ